MNAVVAAAPAVQRGAQELLDRLRALGGERPERAELLAAGVSSRRIDGLYPFEFDEVATVFTRLIRLHGLQHLKDTSASCWRASMVVAILNQPQLFGMSSAQQEIMRQAFNHQAAEATASQQVLFATIRRTLPRGRRSEAVHVMHALWLCCWMQANRAQFGVGPFSRFIESNLTELVEKLLPNFDAAIERFSDEPPRSHFSQLRAVLTKLVRRR